MYDALNALAANERTGKRKRRKSNSRNGVYRKTAQRYMESLGWRWVPTMQIGSGCKVHLADGELPSGRLVVSLSRHMTAVIGGVIRDTFNPSRDESWEIWNNVTPEFIARNMKPDDRLLDGNLHKRIGGRCVYGYFVQA